MNKIGKFVGALSLSALATIGCKSEEAPPPQQGTGTTTAPAQGSCNAQGQPSGTTTSTEQHSCNAGH